MDRLPGVQILESGPDSGHLLRVAEIPIDGTLDLHAFAPRDVTRAVEAYLEACGERGVLQVRLIHGKGKGVQRAAVQRLLSKHPLVRSFRTADESGGGWGATLVDLVDPGDARSSPDQEES